MLDFDLHRPIQPYFFFFLVLILASHLYYSLLFADSLTHFFAVDWTPMRERVVEIYILYTKETRPRIMGYLAYRLVVLNHGVECTDFDDIHVRDQGV